MHSEPGVWAECEYRQGHFTVGLYDTQEGSGDGSSKKFVEYLLRLSWHRADTVVNWLVPRRYSEFYNLNEEIKSLFSSTRPVPKMPGKTLFGGPKVVQARRQQLMVYLMDLLKHYPEVLTIGVVDEFFTLTPRLADALSEAVVRRRCAHPLPTATCKPHLLPMCVCVCVCVVLPPPDPGRAAFCQRRV